ncbi:glyoxalase [Candidatus Peribacteria bacterium RIFCSPHIGHO2_02_FULL_53_20]|nr:MAG: glyoxalase [Candidatus Peribacteria bacterium RIFCSPHIGHO2_02_FULL_53_20]OGJ67151.1 MAG: glyoxalase [Candidatus Peribacteria bacterium RIFCSPLOWO2_01_FULL_53_10]OGJ75055.1 MAG: glyoxalase [Candidatus Peribacteria bacterium RIFCSPLOWO2_12_FULL_53_10]
MDGIVHFELPVDDLARARAFYSIFGWALQDWPMPDGSTYVGIHTTPIDEKTRLPLEVGAINGGMLLRNKEVQAPVFAINVSSIDEKVEQLLKVGGTVVKPKVDMMGMGFYAYVKDTEGNVIGLWEDAKK